MPSTAPLAAPLPESAPPKPAADGIAPLPPALDGQLRFASGFGPRLALYTAMPEGAQAARDMTPLVLVHSVNAAASAAEVRPVYKRYGATRPVVAVELPGFGSSERGQLDYTPRMMADAILRAVSHMRREGFHQPVDLMAVSLSCAAPNSSFSLSSRKARCISLSATTSNFPDWNNSLRSDSRSVNGSGPALPVKSVMAKTAIRNRFALGTTC